MSGTAPQYVRADKIFIPKEFYDRLNEKSDEVVQRFYNMNMNKYSIWNAICLFTTKIDVNRAAAREILEERDLLKNYYKVFREKKGAYVYTFHETEKEVKRFCEDMNENATEDVVKYMPITKREYKRIRKNYDLKFLGI